MNCENYSCYYFDNIFRALLKDLRNDPEFTCKPRGMEVSELIVPTIVLTNPRKRLIHNPVREANYGFAVGEFLWYYGSNQDLDSILYYNKRMKDFSDDGKTVNSAYGYLANKFHGFSQWDVARDTLLKDRDSRRAVIQIHDPYHQRLASEKGTKDVPCTLSWQFFIRDKMLHMHAHMRSNDVMWGLTYDLFSFTLFQELMMLELREAGLDIQLGSYIHTAGSMHLYDRHYDLADKMLEEYGNNRYDYPAMEPITSSKDLFELYCDQVSLRERSIKKIDLDKYKGGLRWMAERLNEHREKRDGE